jgi:GcrA cell cycle regulator
MNWTDEKFETLKGLLAQNLSASQIGNELGVSRNAVIGKVHRGGLMFARPPSPPKKQARGKPPKRPPSSTALPPEPAAEGKSGPVVSFAELAAHHCRWPVDNHYCGAAAVAGSSYCRHHTVIAHHRGRHE